MTIYRSPTRKSKNKDKKRIEMIVFLSIFVIIILLSYFTIFSNFFKIKESKLSGDIKFLDRELLENEWSEYLSQKKLSNNLLLIKKKNIKNFFSQFLPISDFDIIKGWKNKELEIKIIEKEIFGKLCQKEDYEKCFLFDNKGQIFIAFSNNHLLEKNVLFINDFSGRLYELGDYIFSGEDFDDIIKIKDVADNKFGLIEMEIESKNINLILGNEESNWKIMIDSLDLKRNLLALNNLISQNFDFASLEYLDIRHLPNIYYK